MCAHVVRRVKWTRAGREKSTPRRFEAGNRDIGTPAELCPRGGAGGDVGGRHGRPVYSAPVGGNIGFLLKL